MTSKISIVAASALTLGTCLPVGLAFADPTDPPNVGEQSGAGSTAMTMVWEDAGTEYGGTDITDPEDPGYNPDSDGDGLGDNLAFKAPTAINFVAKASGDLLAPSAAATHIDNFSAFGVHVSSMRITEGEGWDIVVDAEAATGKANAVWGKIGPGDGKVDWSAFVADEKVALADGEAKWGMSALGAADGKDILYLFTEGHVANLDKDLSQARTFGTVNWFLKAGGEGRKFADPDTVALPAPEDIGLTSIHTVAFDTPDLFSNSRILTVGEGGDITMGDLKAVSADIAAHATGTPSVYAETIESYIQNDVSFVFLDDPQGPVNGEEESDCAMEYRIVGVNHSPDDGESGLTFMAKRPLDSGYRMNPTDTNEGGWKMTEMRKELNPHVVDGYNGEPAFKGTLFGLLPQSVRDNARSVTKHNLADGADVPSLDKFWVPSYAEFLGMHEEWDADYDLAGGLNRQYRFFDYAINTLHTTPLLGLSNSIAGNDYLVDTPFSESAGGFWERGAKGDEYIGDGYFLQVSGGDATLYLPATTSSGVVPCFCL